MGKGYGSGSTIDPVYAELERRRRTQEAYRRARQRAEFADGFPQKKWEASPDDRWKDRVIFAVGILVCNTFNEHLLRQFTWLFIVPIRRHRTCNMVTNSWC